MDNVPVSKKNLQAYFRMASSENGCGSTVRSIKECVMTTQDEVGTPFSRA
jgi:hypothetical protein